MDRLATLVFHYNLYLISNANYCNFYYFVINSLHLSSYEYVYKYSHHSNLRMKDYVDTSYLTKFAVKIEIRFV